MKGRRGSTGHLYPPRPPEVTPRDAAQCTRELPRRKAFSFDPMNPRETGHLTDDLLFSLQLRVARRADELRRNPQVAPSLNLHCWLLAESEIFAGLEDEDPAPGAMSLANAPAAETADAQATAAVAH